MTSHQLAKYLMELPDRPVVTSDEDGFFHDILSLIPVTISGVENGSKEFYVEAKTTLQRNHAFTAFLLS